MVEAAPLTTWNLSHLLVQLKVVTCKFCMASSLLSSGEDFNGGPTVRAPVLLTLLITSITILPSSAADAQVRVARPRAVVGRPLVVARPTVFVGGYYYPSLYRASLSYDPWGPGWGPVLRFLWVGLRLWRAGLRRYYQYPIYGGRYDNSGSVRLQVSPSDAEVFVDGYFAGRVDDFDGVFQRLNIAPGEHEIQVYLAGYRPFTQRFYLQPGKSFNIKHAMEPLGPGEVARRDRIRRRTLVLDQDLVQTTPMGAASARAVLDGVHEERVPAVGAVKAAACVRVVRRMASDRSRCACSPQMLTS